MLIPVLREVLSKAKHSTKGLSICWGRSPKKWFVSGLGPCGEQRHKPYIYYWWDRGQHSHSQLQRHGKPVLTADPSSFYWHSCPGVGKLPPVDPIQPADCFCAAHELRMAFTFFKWLKKKNYKFYGTWKSYEILVPINKALLEHCHSCSFVYCLWLLLCYNGSHG